jgi:predicted transcriptional regulator
MNEKEDILELATDLVASYVRNNQIDADQLPNLLTSVFETMHEIVHGEDPQNTVIPVPAVPAVPVDQSVHDDYLICLEDGQKYKSLKRHLRTKFELTPKAYREKWGLPTDYPMVAHNYSRERSRLAKRTGLGKS